MCTHAETYQGRPKRGEDLERCANGILVSVERGGMIIVAVPACGRKKRW